ncbi:MAG: hypothetical protein HUJ25_12460 [Crocinitomicaceae bacterium]|nr:hypothetical protein [Crocinitomicaceae bacterium]
MKMIDEMLDSEYNNVGELFGFGELEKATRHMSPTQRVKAISRLSRQVKGSRRSRAEMEKFFKQLPGHVKQELVKGKLRLADWTIYSIKQIKSKTIKMFEPQDDKHVGLRNISNAKLPKNSVFLVSAIILLTGVSDDPNDEEANKGINFKTISTVPAIANGEFSLKANKTQIVPENQSNRRFVTDNDHTLQWGYYKLDNPRLIKDEEVIEMVIELGTQYQIPPEQFLFAALDGTATTP